MSQFTTNALDSEMFNQYTSIRLTELNNQHWNRNKSTALAKNEGISLNDEHCAVIVYLRNYHLEHGLPRFSRTTASALNRQFAIQGGNKYLCVFLLAARLRKAAALPNFANPPTPPTFRLAPAIEKHTFWLREGAPRL